MNHQTSQGKRSGKQCVSEQQTYNKVNKYVERKNQTEEQKGGTIIEDGTEDHRTSTSPPPRERASGKEVGTHTGEGGDHGKRRRGT
mmetsp:Transcript_51011/g.76269  ORF Transcript_51011/g.76269 Transcript_51011/m.76269 type:complete len:86 (+) Transcript_51011:89-346(+)